MNAVVMIAISSGPNAPALVPAGRAGLAKVRPRVSVPHPARVYSDVCNRTVRFRAQPAHVHAQRSADYILEVYQLKYVQSRDSDYLMQFSGEQFVAIAKKFREQAKIVSEPARGRLIKRSNSCLAAAVLAATSRGGISTDAFNFDALTLDTGPPIDSVWGIGWSHNSARTPSGFSRGVRGSIAPLRGTHGRQARPWRRPSEHRSPAACPLFGDARRA